MYSSQKTASQKHVADLFLKNKEPQLHDHTSNVSFMMKAANFTNQVGVQHLSDVLLWSCEKVMELCKYFTAGWIETTVLLLL